MRIYNTDRSLSDKSESSEMSCSSLKISSSSSSASSSVNFPANCRKWSPKRANISMHNFINSKGLSAAKESYFSPFVSFDGKGFLNNSSDNYYELKPPQFVKKDVTTIRRRVSAICKIQEELKEMKEREEELRWERVRKVGMSVPNLNTFSDESDDGIRDEVLPSRDELLIIRTNSNPNLIENDSTSGEESMDQMKTCEVGGPRKRIPLIAIWEQKIQNQ